jgi:tyrosinase
LSVVDVIAEFPSDQQQRWKRAAATLRMPYWDWAMDPGNGQPTVPTAIRDQQVTVIKPSGEQTINNPLYSYTWGDSLPSEIGGGPWDSFPKTLRRPVAGPTRSNNNEMAARFDNMRISLRDRVFALFSSKQPWGFATTSAIGVRTDLSGSGVDSFESVHDAIHNTAGGESGGHMYYLDMSAFDPIFWLHHTNIDRLTNMYQYIVPNSYVANGNINHPMAQWNEGEPKNSYTPLKPFTKGTYGEYYTSEDVRETRVLGYYYPETSDRSYGQVAQAVTRLYGAGVRSITKRSVLGDIVDDVVDTVGDIVDGTTKKTSQYLGRQFREGDYHTVLTVTADKFAMEGGYTVHCFIGDKGNSTSNSTAPYTNGTLPHSTGTSSSVRIPLSTSTGTPKPSKNSTSAPEADYDPSKDFTNDPNYVGAYGVLGGMKPGGHNSSYPVITRGSLPLTTCLMGKQAAGLLSSLKPTDIEAYLQKNLYYKVIGVNGELDPTKIPSFHVSVGCTKVTPAKNEFELPDLSKPYEILPKATEHLPAGKPFTYVPTPNDIPLPNASYGENGSGFPGSNNNNNGNGYPSMPSPVAGVKPYPTSGAMPLPWQESGYCVTEQTIRYVYPDGKAAAY